MKYVYWFLTVLILLFATLYFLLFSNYGNSLVKPYIAKEMQKYIKNQVAIPSFTLKPNFIDLEILLDKDSRIILNGDYSLFEKTFKIDYMMAVKDVKTNYGNIEGILALKGLLKGNLEDFTISSEGEVFNAKTKLNASVKKQTLHSLDIDTKNLHVERVLALLNQPIYSKGFLDINAKIAPTNEGKLKGDGKININFGQLNAKEISKAYAVNIPENMTYRGEIDFVVDEEQIRASSNIISNLFKIDNEHIIYEIPTKKLYSDYTLVIPSLGQLKEIIGIDLYGAVTVIGDIIKDDKNLKVNAYSKLLGGELTASLENQMASMKLQKLSIGELLKMLKMEHYSDGEINSHIEVSNLENFDFQSLTTISDAKLDGKTLEKSLEKKSVPNIPYTFELKAGGKDKLVQIDTQVLSEVLEAKLFESNFDISKQLLIGKYSLHVDSLLKLEFLLGQKLSEKLDTQGEVKFENGKVELLGESDFLSAKTNYSLQDDLLKLKSNELMIQNITDMLEYPKVFESYATLDAMYNLKDSNGEVQLEATNGKLIASQLTNLVSTLTNFDMTEEIYTKSVLKGLIKKENIDFSLLMEGLNSSLKMENGALNTQTKKINATFGVKIKEKDLGGTISGNLEKPKININSSDYIKQKLDKQIDKHVPEEWKAPVKDLLKLFG